MELFREASFRKKSKSENPIQKAARFPHNEAISSERMYLKSGTSEASDQDCTVRDIMVHASSPTGENQGRLAPGRPGAVFY
jgi:hypothetical protein